MLKLFTRFLALAWLLLLGLLFIMRSIGQANAIPNLSYLSNIDTLNTDIMLADANTGLVVNLSHTESRDDSLQWSPDGRYLLYRSTGESYWNFYLLDTNTWQTRHLIELGDETSFYFFWMNPHEILFSDYRESSIINVKTGISRIPNAEDNCSPYCFWGVMAPDYLPEPNLVGDEVHVELVEINWDSNPQIDIEDFPIWSPDKAYFLFRSALQGQAEVYMASTAGGIARRLTHSEAYEHTITWSSDSQWISYASYINARLDVFVLELASLETKNISHYFRPDFEPAWQPLP